MGDQEDDVLSLSVHDECISVEGISGEDTDVSVDEFVVIDEIGPDDESEHHSSLESNPVEPLSEPPSSSGAPGSMEWQDDSVGDSVCLVKSRERLRECDVCNLQTRGKIRRHVLKKHLPWFWYGTTACWDCGTQEAQASSLTIRHTNQHQMNCLFDEEHLHLWCQMINGSLHLLRSWFDCDGLDGLLKYVLERRLYENVQSGFSGQEEQLLLFYANNYSPKSVAYISVNPPNHVVALVNWEIMVALLRRLGTKYHEAFLKYRACLTYEGKDVTEPILELEENYFFVDSHFHLDLVLQRLRFRNFHHLQSTIAPYEGHGFYYGIANYVFPQHWNKWAVQVGTANNIYVSFGVHPHVAANGMSGRMLGELEVLSTNYKCVAIGEIGLDTTSKCQCRPCRTPDGCWRRIRDSQEQAFTVQLQLASRRRLPVILHFRDSGDGSAAKRALELIRDGGYVNLGFHWHCFTGGIQELQEWQTLPNIVFGITTKSISDSPNAYAVIPRILPHQLVLETDSPFLSPLSCCPVNHPWNIRFVAEEVGRLRNVPLSILTWMVNNNAMQLYGVPKLNQCQQQGPSAPLH